MAKRKKKIPRLTAEDHARFDETTRMLRERIAYHAERAKEEEARSHRAR